MYGLSIATCTLPKHRRKIATLLGIKFHLSLKGVCPSVILTNSCNSIDCAELDNIHIHVFLRNCNEVMKEKVLCN